MTKTNVSRRVTATILSMSLLTVMAGAALLIIVTNLFFLPLSRVLRTRAIATTAYPNSG